MKYVISLFLIVSFIGIGVSSATFFGMGVNHAGGCAASIIDGTLCPTNLVDFATHHLSALQILTGTAMPSNSSWILLIASLLLASVSLVLFYKNLLRPKLESLLQRLSGLSFNLFYNRRKIISWLSLFKLSPAL